MTSGLSILNLRVNASATGNDIVDEIDLEIQKGRVTGLVGESGSGKTTVGLAVLGHARRGVEIVQGEIYCDDTEVLNLEEGSKREIRGSLVSYVPQDPTSSLNPALRIGVQILEVLETHDFGGSDQARRVRVREMMAEVLLPADDEYLERYPHQLSGGQQQRVAIARVMAQESNLILADEPVASLDPLTSRQVLSQLKDIAAESNMAILCSLHQTDLALEFADRIIAMSNGIITLNKCARDVHETELASVYSNALP